MLPRLIALLLATPLLLATATALAQATPEEQAEERNEQGLRCVDQGSFLEAVEEFRAAYRLAPKAKYLFNTARAFHVMGRFRSALEYYNRFLDLNDSAKKAERVAELIGELSRQLATLVVEVAEPGAALKVDGDAALCRPNESCLLDPGNHNFEVSKEGFATVERKVRIDAGETLKEPVMLAELALDVVPRSSVLWRSALFPGMGQYYAGRSGPGTAFLVSEIAMLAVTALGLIGEQYYSGQQSREKDPEIWSDFNIYIDTSHWLWIGGASAAGLVWAVNLVHAAAMPLRRETKLSAPSAWLLTPVVEPGGGVLSFAARW